MHFGKTQMADSTMYHVAFSNSKKKVTELHKGVCTHKECFQKGEFNCVRLKKVNQSYFF